MRQNTCTLILSVALLLCLGIADVIIDQACGRRGDLMCPSGYQCDERAYRDIAKGIGGICYPTRLDQLCGAPGAPECPYGYFCFTSPTGDPELDHEGYCSKRFPNHCGYQSESEKYRCPTFFFCDESHVGDFAAGKGGRCEGDLGDCGAPDFIPCPKGFYCTGHQYKDSQGDYTGLCLSNPNSTYNSDTAKAINESITPNLLPLTPTGPSCTWGTKDAKFCRKDQVCVWAADPRRVKNAPGVCVPQVPCGDKYGRDKCPANWLCTATRSNHEFGHCVFDWDSQLASSSV